MEELKNRGIIIFYNTDFRFFLIRLFSDNSAIYFPLGRNPDDIIADIIKFLSNKEQKIQTLLIQDPETINSIAPAYHKFNRFKQIPKYLLQQKITEAKKFVEVAKNKIPEMFSGFQIEIVEAVLDDFIRDEKSHQIRSPQAADQKTQNWIRNNFAANVIKCEQDDNPIPCPVCWHDRYLRGWGVGDRTLALCYNCGAIFFCDNGHVLLELTGDRLQWGAMGISIAGSYKMEQEKKT